MKLEFRFTAGDLADVFIVNTDIDKVIWHDPYDSGKLLRIDDIIAAFLAVAGDFHTEAFFKVVGGEGAFAVFLVLESYTLDGRNGIFVGYCAERIGYCRFKNGFGKFDLHM